MARRKRKNPAYIAAYGEPITLAIVGGLTLAGAIGAGIHSNVENEKKAKELKKKKDREKKKEEAELKLRETEGAITQSQIDAVNTDIALRENLAQSQYASERETTQYVDEYRRKAGLTGDNFDAVLNSLYREERDLTERTMLDQLGEEQKELDQKNPPKMGHQG